MGSLLDLVLPNLIMSFHKNRWLDKVVRLDEIHIKNQKDGKLAFLRVLILKSDQNFCTSINRKMTSLSLLLLPCTLTKLNYLEI